MEIKHQQTYNSKLKVMAKVMAALSVECRKGQNKALSRAQRNEKYDKELTTEQLASRAARAARAWEDFKVLRNIRLEGRPEARSIHLARAFIKGTPYRAVENTCHHDPEWDYVMTVVSEFTVEDDRAAMQRFEEWKTVDE